MPSSAAKDRQGSQAAARVPASAKKQKKKHKKKAPAGAQGRERTESTSGAAVAGEKKKAATEDIDDIFASGASKKKAKASTEERTLPISAAQVTISVPDEDDGFSDSRGLRKKKRKMIDGLRVYTDEELKLGGGGGTADCPFDCDCCF